MDPESIRALALEHTEHAVVRAQAYPYRRGAVEQVAAVLTRSKARACVLDAPRRTGKTVALRQLALKLRSEGALVTYCDLTDSRLRGLQLRDLIEALSKRGPAGRLAVLLLDEVHYAGEGWARDLKFAVDRDDSNASRIAIADSAVSFVKSMLKTEMADRYERVAIHPLSFLEWRALRSALEIPLSDEHDEAGIATELREYLQLGGFPEHVASRGELLSVRDRLRHMVIDQAVREDIGRLRELRDIDSLERLFVARLAESGAQLKVHEAAKQARVSAPTVRHWLDAICDTGLLWALEPYGRSAGKFERAQPKLYAVDPSLVGACSLPVFGPDSAQLAELAGRELETAVAQALRIFCESASAGERRLSVYQHKKSDRIAGELDFVLEAAGQRHAIEVTARHDEKKIGKLFRIGRELDASWLGVVSLRARAETVTREGYAIHLVPAHEFLLRLARAEESWPW